MRLRMLIKQHEASASLRSLVAESSSLVDLHNRSACSGVYLYTHLAERPADVGQRWEIIDGSKPWLSIFSILFETVSAYGTVGLSLGSSDNNFS